jgi:hypothetical protein
VCGSAHRIYGGAVMSEESGARSQELGVRSKESGVIGQYGDLVEP